MAAHITMWTYVWDLVYDGVEDTLRYLKDEIGLTAVSVATSYHTVEHLRPHGKGPFIYRDKGALYFQPSRERYEGTDIRPRLSGLVKDHGNPLRRISEQCQKLGLGLVSWTVCCHNSWLGEHYPELTLSNCFGDRYPEALCPGNPNVRAYLAGLVEDLTANYGVRLAELEACHYEAQRHYHHHEKISILFGELEDFLLGLCFCPSCSERGQKAGLDINGLRARVAGTLRHVFETGEPEGRKVSEFLAGDAELARFVEMRIDVVTSLLREMRARSRAPLSAMSWAPAEACGLDVKRAAEVVESITVLAYSPSPEKIRAIVSGAADPAGGPAKIRAGYHTYPPETPDLSALRATVGAALQLGVRAFSFYNYGIMPRRSLAWTREAVRLIRAA